MVIVLQKSPRLFPQAKHIWQANVRFYGPFGQYELSMACPQGLQSFWFEYNVYVLDLNMCSINLYLLHFQMKIHFIRYLLIL